MKVTRRTAMLVCWLLLECVRPVRSVFSSMRQLEGVWQQRGQLFSEFLVLSGVHPNRARFERIDHIIAEFQRRESDLVAAYRAGGKFQLEVFVPNSELEKQKGSDVLPWEIPVASYVLLFALRELQHLTDEMDQHSSGGCGGNTTSCPKHEDLLGAAKSIVRLAGTYRPSVHSFLSGRWPHFVDVPLSRDEALPVIVEALYQWESVSFAMSLMSHFVGKKSYSNPVNCSFSDFSRQFIFELLKVSDLIKKEGGKKKFASLPNLIEQFAENCRNEEEKTWKEKLKYVLVEQGEEIDEDFLRETGTIGVEDYEYKGATVGEGSKGGEGPEDDEGPVGNKGVASGEGATSGKGSAFGEDSTSDEGAAGNTDSVVCEGSAGGGGASGCGGEGTDDWLMALSDEGRLCGNSSEGSPPPLRCTYVVPRENPLLRFKVEYLNEKPIVALFHDAVGREEMESIKTLSWKVSMKKAEVLSGSRVHEDNYVSESRVGVVAWLNNDIHPVVSRLNKRFSLMTGLSTDHDQVDSGAVIDDSDKTEFGEAEGPDAECRAESCAGDGEKNLQAGSSERTQEAGSSERTQEAGSSERTQEAGSSERTQEAGSSERTQETDTAAKKNLRTDEEEEEYEYEYEHKEIFVEDFQAVAEPLQVVNYGLGGVFRLHTDNLPQANDREATLLVYLSSPRVGGATVFPQLNLRVAARAGSALFWYNTYTSGGTNPLMMHAGCPVAVGEKWIANKWFLLFGQAMKQPCKSADAPATTRQDT